MRFYYQFYNFYIRKINGLQEDENMHKTDLQNSLNFEKKRKKNHLNNIIM